MSFTSLKDANSLFRNKDYFKSAEAYLRIYFKSDDKSLKKLIPINLYILAKKFDDESPEFKNTFFRKVVDGQWLPKPCKNVKLPEVSDPSYIKTLLNTYLWGSTLENTQQLSQNQFLALTKKANADSEESKLLQTILSFKKVTRNPGFSWIVYARSPTEAVFKDFLAMFSEIQAQSSQAIELLIVLTEDRPDLLTVLKDANFVHIQLLTERNASLAEAWDLGVENTTCKKLLFSDLAIEIGVSTWSLLQDKLANEDTFVTLGSTDPADAYPFFVATHYAAWQRLGGFFNTKLHEILELILSSQAEKQIQVHSLDTTQVKFDIQIKHPVAEHLSLEHIKSRAESAFDLNMDTKTDEVSQADWYFYLGIAREMQLKWETAMEAYQQAIEHGRHDSETYFRLARVALEQGNESEAAKARIQATRLYATVLNIAELSKHAFEQDQFLIADYTLDLEKKKQLIAIQ